MPDWISHGIVAVVSAALGWLGNFLLNWRKQSSAERQEAADGWRAIAEKQDQWITVLEGRCEQLHTELMTNLKALGAADEKTKRLEAQNAAQQERIEQQQRQIEQQQREIESLRAEVAVLRKDKQGE